MKRNTVTCLRPEIPLVWATDTSLRFGVDAQIARFERPSAALQRLLGELGSGVPTADIPKRAHLCGIPPSDVPQLLEQLQPVLTVRPARETEQTRSVRIEAPGPVNQVLTAAFRTAGFTVVHNPSVQRDAAPLLIIVERYMGNVLASARRIAQGLRLLPIRFSDRSVTIGPVTSHLGPCPRCLVLHAETSDPEWTRCALQLLGAPAPSETPALQALAAAYAIALAQEWFANGDTAPDTQHRLAADPQGTLSHASTRSVPPHVACACGTPASSKKRDGARSPRAAPEIHSSSRARVSAT